MSHLNHLPPADKLSEMGNAIDLLNQHIKKLESQVNTCLNNDKITASILARLEAGQKRLLNYTRTLEDYCLELDVTIKKKHIILTGVPEDVSEQKSLTDNSEGEGEIDQFATHRVALKTLVSIHDTLTFDDIDCAYRIGRKGNKPRPILAKFCRESVRDLVNKKRFHLKECDDTKSTYLNDDLPAKINQQRADMRSVVENAKSKNVNAKTVGNKVQVGDKTYEYRDLHLLPEGLKLEDAKTKVTQKGLAFQGQHSIFSNFYPTQVSYNGKVFPSSEHAYQFDRVTYLGDSKLAAQVFHAHTPQVAKRLGGQIRPSKKWYLIKVDRMKKITLAKYNQNPRLKNELLKTAPSPLIEATIDSFWGCGLTFNPRNLISGQWNGKNQMGLILMECRNELQHALFAQQQQQPYSSQMFDLQANNPYFQSGQPFPPNLLSMQSQYSQQLLPHPPLHPPPPPPYPPASQVPPQFDHNLVTNRDLASQLHYQHFQPTASSQPVPSTQTNTQYSACDASPASSLESFSQGQRRLAYDPNLSPMLVA